MKTRLSRIIFCAIFVAVTAQAEGQAPQTEEELAKQTALLKAQQAYYDQLLLTAKSQQAANEESIALETASVTAATQLQTAKYNSDLALSSAIKGSGLSAAAGKEGGVTLASADKTWLALQRDSLEVVTTISAKVCEQLRPKLSGPPSTQAFLAPANYEMLVEKSIPDIVQLTSLHNAATLGTEEFKGAQMQVAGTALAGALVSIQYLAGGVQALSKLFRTDSSVTYSAANRQGLFEQTLAATCPDLVLGNVEGRLRLGAAKILYAWLPEMAKFAELYDMWSELTTQRKAALMAKKTAIANLKPKTDPAKKENEANLKLLDDALKGLSKQEETLAKYKVAAASIKTYMGSLGAGTVYDSLVWGQQYVHRNGGVPTEVVNLGLEKLPRLLYTLSVQDANVKTSSAFRADKIRYFATAELSYSLLSADSAPLAAGVFSISTEPKDLKVKDLKGDSYTSVLPLQTAGQKPPANP